MQKKYKPDLLLDKRLIRPDKFHSARNIIKETGDPVGKLICDGLVITERFYPNLAEIFDLTYQKSLLTYLSPHKSVALYVPSKILLSNRLYPYEEDGNLYIASSTPFVESSVIKEILSYVPFKTAGIVISHPTEITNALSQTFYKEISISSEERVEVLQSDSSARTYETKIVPKLFPIGTFIILFILFLFYPGLVIFWIFTFLNFFYFIINPFKIYLFLRSFKPFRKIDISKKEIDALGYNELPIYSILIPLRNEAVMVHQILANVLKIDYPKDKLDIKLIVEVGDSDTINALRKNGIGIASDNASVEAICTEVVKVPKGTVMTKPRACNFALGFSRGSYTVIYDAEDRPDILQLKKAYLGFMKSKLGILCIQAKLNFYNSRKNLLTRFFSLEYGFWFEYFLPGLQDIASPIPLGGTSNHFITSYLRKVGTWDPFNVTEDADLGLRIFRNGFRTAIINSHTLEEANSRIFNWIRQRTRWQKGFLLTFLVHTSHPIQLIREIGIIKFALSILTFGGNFFMPFFNPVLWMVFIASYTPVLSLFEIDLPDRSIAIIAGLNLFLGNLTYIVIHAISSIKLKRWDLTVISFFIPFYWMLISIATIRAGFQFVINPYLWEKTRHGLKK